MARRTWQQRAADNQAALDKRAVGRAVEAVRVGAIGKALAQGKSVREARHVGAVAAVKAQPKIVAKQEAKRTPPPPPQRPAPAPAPTSTIGPPPLPPEIAGPSPMRGASVRSAEGQEKLSRADMRSVREWVNGEGGIGRYGAAMYGGAWQVVDAANAQRWAGLIVTVDPKDGAIVVVAQVQLTRSYRECLDELEAMADLSAYEAEGIALVLIPISQEV